MRKIITVFLLAAVLLSTFAETTHAAPTLKIYAAETTTTSADVYWAKARGTIGYDVFANNRVVSTPRPKARITGLAPNKTYRATVKAYTKRRASQFFNSKTKKWQYKRPPLKFWKGKKRRVVLRKIYTSSGSYVFTTKPIRKNVTVCFVSQSGPITSEEITLTKSNGSCYKALTDANGCISANFSNGNYKVDIKNDTFTASGDVSISDTTKRVTVTCDEKLAFLSVIIDSPGNETVDVTLTDINGNIVAVQEDFPLIEGYNYPLDANVSKGAYTAIVKRNGSEYRQNIIIDVCGNSYSAFFEQEQQMEVVR